MSEKSRLALPFVVGITGHRRVADPELLKAELKDRLVEMAAAVPACHPVFLSQLAAGVDQIAAQVALDLGWRLVAVLPFPPDDPRHGFSDRERIEFDELLDRAEYWIDAPALAGLGASTASADEAYFLSAGQYIANASHVLISAWDGVDTPAVGGTADITRYRMGMRPLRIDPLSLEAIMEEWKLLMIVPTRREGEQVPPRCTAGWYTSRSAVLNRRPRFHNAGAALKCLESFDDASASIDAANEKAVVAEGDLGQLYEVADSLATTNVKWLRKHWRQSFVMAIVALVSAAIYGDLQNFVPVPALFLGTYLVALAILWMWIQREVRGTKVRNPWDWRLFAEILRVLQAWRSVDYCETEPSLAPTLGARQHVPSWVIHAYRGLALSCPSDERMQSGGGSVSLNEVENYVDGQIRYFDRVIRTADQKKHTRRLSASGLPIGAILAVGCLILEILGQDGPLLVWVWFAAGLLPGLGAAGLVFSELSEKAGASAAAERQRRKLKAVKVVLHGIPAPAKLRSQIAEAGRLAIVEVCVFHENAKLSESETKGFLG